MKITIYDMREKGSGRSLSRYLPAGLIVFIGVVYFLLSFDIVFLGDDLGFYHSFEAQNDCWYALPRSMYRHWQWNNGRMADMLTPVGLNLLPMWANGLLNGLMTAGMFFFTVRLASGRRGLSAPWKVGLIFVMVFTLRWDALWMEFITQYNYVFSTAIALAMLAALLGGNRDEGGAWRVLSIPVCFVAGAMHEALGFPIAVGLLVYYFLCGGRRVNWSKARLAMGAAMVAGGIFPLTSPPAWGRIGSMLQPEPWWEMMVFSAGWLCVLVLAVAFRFIFSPGEMRRKLRSPWVIFASASLVSCAFMLTSQYGGRTGWFCQIFALIALWQLLGARPDTRRSNSVWTAIFSWTAAVFVVAHLTAVVIWQHRLAKETRSVIALYEKSPDQPVFFDYTPDEDIPFYVMRKTHGVPDDDDSYYRYRVALHHGDGRDLVILPEAARALLADSLTDSVRVDDRFVVSPYSLRPAYGDTIFSIFPRTMTRIGGKEYIEKPFVYGSRRLFLYAPVDRDRGEK